MSKAIEKFSTPSFLAPRPDVNLPILKPGEVNAGLEEVEAKDMVMPRLGICQAMSPQRKANNARFIEGLQEGQLFNTVTGQIYTPPVYVVPLKFWKSRLYFAPLDQGGGILCQSLNGRDGGQLSPEGCDKCPHSQWNAQTNQKPACTLLHNFLCLRLPELEPFAISMKSASLRISRQWNAQLKLLNRPIYSACFEVSVADDQNKLGQWFNYRLKPAGWLNDPELLKQAADLQASMAAKTITVEVETLTREPGDEEENTEL